jgi:hypothetical protein
MRTNCMEHSELAASMEWGKGTPIPAAGETVYVFDSSISATGTVVSGDRFRRVLQTAGVQGIRYSRERAVRMSIIYRTARTSLRGSSSAAIHTGEREHILTKF